MIKIPIKRIYGLIGIPRIGKNSLAQFLADTRDFIPMAFADSIKKEFGISKEYFEEAKIAGNIEELRNKLWNFSAKMKEKDPLYFIRGVMEKAISSAKQVIITDIRTSDEIDAFYNYEKSNEIRRIYFITGEQNKTEKGLIPGSKLTYETLEKYRKENDLRTIVNFKKGLYYFYQDLDKLFFSEDIKDLLTNQTEKEVVEKYIEQFDIRQIKKDVK